jgi:hypothetical protein
VEGGWPNAPTGASTTSNGVEAGWEPARAEASLRSCDDGWNGSCWAR